MVSIRAMRPAITEFLMGACIDLGPRVGWRRPDSTDYGGRSILIDGMPT
jgi:hypothetical protein